MKIRLAFLFLISLFLAGVGCTKTSTPKGFIAKSKSFQLSRVSIERVNIPTAPLR